MTAGVRSSFVGSDAQKVEVNETPEQILATASRHSRDGVTTSSNKMSGYSDMALLDLRTIGAHPDSLVSGRVSRTN